MPIDLKKLPRLHDPAANARITRYIRELDRLTGAALDGRLFENEFQGEMIALTAADLELLFQLAGGDPASAVGQLRLQNELLLHRQSIATLTNDIYTGRYSARSEPLPGRPEQTAVEGRDKLRNRLVLWGFSAAGVFHLGQETIRPGQLEPAYVWLLGNTEEHCVDCQLLDGVVLTASDWGRLDIRPQSPGLACGGYHCDCGREPTNQEPIPLDEVAI